MPTFTDLRTSSERTRGAQTASAHVMTLAPPLNISPHWLGAHPTYTLSKYGMRLLSLGWLKSSARNGVGPASDSPACGRRRTSQRQR